MDENYLTLDKCEPGRFVYYRDMSHSVNFLEITKISKNNIITCKIRGRDKAVCKHNFPTHHEYVQPWMHPVVDICGMGTQETEVRLRKMRISPGHYAVDNQIVYLFDPENPPVYQLIEL